MKQAHLKFYSFLSGRSYLLQVVTLYLLTFVVAVASVPLLLVTTAIEGENNSGPNKGALFAAIVLAPLVETLVFQLLVFKIFERLKWRHNYFWPIAISSFLFGLSHFYSLTYIVFASFVGIVLAYTYYFYRSNPKQAFWTTALIHCLHNITSALLFGILLK